MCYKIITGNDSYLSKNIGKLTNKIFNNEGLSYFTAHSNENIQTKVNDNKKNAKVNNLRKDNLY